MLMIFYEKSAFLRGIIETEFLRTEAKQQEDCL